MLDMAEDRTSITASTTRMETVEDRSTERWWHVNRKLLSMKLHWFLYFGSCAAITPARVLYCARIGMSMREIGILYAAMTSIEIFSKVIFGGIADKYRKHKTLFMASILFFGIFMFSVNFMPFPSNDLRNVQWTPADGVSVECRRHQSEGSSSIGMVHLRMCDARNASSPYFTVLSSATVACNVSCNFSKLPFHVCDTDTHNLNCTSSDGYRYSFNETRNADFRLLNLKMSPVDELSGHQSGNYSSCATLPIANITFDSDSAITCRTLSLQMQQMNETMATRCHLNADIETSLSCQAVCTAKVRPSVYTPDAQGTTLQYVWIWVAYIAGYACYGTLMSTTDTIILHLLDKRTDHYGKTRLFATFGWGLIAPIIGLIVDKVSEGKAEKDYSPAFYLFGAFILVDFFVNIRTKVSIPLKSKELAKDVLKVLRRPPLILLMFAVFAQGMTTGFLWTFLVVYVNDLSNGVQLVLGLNYAIECFLSEMPLFAVSGWIISKIGHSHTMTISLLANGLRTFLYSLLQDPWYILFIALLHGFTYGLVYASMATYFNMVAPPGTAATFQGIFQGIYEGIGVAVGNLVGGYVYQRFGGRQAMFLFGVATMAAGVLHFVIALIMTWIVARRPSNSDQQPKLPSFPSDAFQSKSRNG